jgi:hypothetical protein
LNPTPDWPDLPYRAWRDTAATLQLWMQIVGKVRLKLTPWLNHGWQVPFYVTSRGLATSPIPAGREVIELEFDFISHNLALRMSTGDEREIQLKPQSVAEFHARVMEMLQGVGVAVDIADLPNEVPDPLPFSRDHTHSAYDADAARRFWRALLPIDRTFKLFRTGFLGKASPVHFFWGGFDLAVTRFSGRRAPLHPGGIPGLPDRVTREAYSHEVSSAGFWPGNESFPRAAFYSYAYPEPAGIRERPTVHGAAYNTTLGEFILPYDTVRTASDPGALLLDFLSSTYAAAADTGRWDRQELDCGFGAPGRVREL